MVIPIYVFEVQANFIYNIVLLLENERESGTSFIGKRVDVSISRY